MSEQLKAEIKQLERGARLYVLSMIEQLATGAGAEKAADFRERLAAAYEEDDDEDEDEPPVLAAAASPAAAAPAAGTPSGPIGTRAGAQSRPAAMPVGTQQPSATQPSATQPAGTQPGGPQQGS